MKNNYRINLVNDYLKKLNLKQEIRDYFFSKNILCFIDNREEINLVDVGANEGFFSKDFLNFLVYFSSNCSFQ